MKASEVKVGDWVGVDSPSGEQYVKVRFLRDGGVVMGAGKLTVRIHAHEDDPDCRKLDADEVSALMLQ
jgi:hypothetical protein